MPQSIVNFECFDTSIQNITHTNEWKQLQNTFNEKKVIILFGHGGNMGVCDHGSIDISRLTDKTSLSPGSAILMYVFNIRFFF